MMNFDSTSKMSKEAMDSMLTTVSSMTKGFQQIAAEATEYSKKSYEDNAAVVEKLVSAKSFDKAIEIRRCFIMTRSSVRIRLQERQTRERNNSS